MTHVKENKKMLVSLPANFVADIEDLALKNGLTQNTVVCRAIEFYVKQCKRESLNQQLCKGYEDMADINLAIANGTDLN